MSNMVWNETYSCMRAKKKVSKYRHTFNPPLSFIVLRMSVLYNFIIVGCRIAANNSVRYHCCRSVPLSKICS